MIKLHLPQTEQKIAHKRSLKKISSLQESIQLASVRQKFLILVLLSLALIFDFVAVRQFSSKQTTPSVPSEVPVLPLAK